MDVEHFAPNCGRGDGAGRRRRQERRRRDLIAQGGSVLRAIAPVAGLQRPRPRQGEIAGHRALGRCRHCQGTDTGRRLVRRARSPMPTMLSTTSIARPMAPTPPQLASLAYDAVSLVALLAHGHALSPLHPGGPDGSERLCRRQRHLPLQCRRHVGARAGGAGGPAGRLPWSSARRRRRSRPSEASSSASCGDHAVEHQAARAAWRDSTSPSWLQQALLDQRRDLCRHAGACSSARR